MASSRSLKVAPESKLHKRLCAMISSRVKLAERGHSKRHDKWQEAEETTVAFVPESEADFIRTNKRRQGMPAYTTIKLPYSYAVLMAAHTYWTSVFFSRSPVHQYSGRHGEGEMQIQALEALIAYQVEVGGMMPPYYIWLYDAGKYGEGITGTFWDIHKIHYGEIVEMEDPEAPGAMKLYQATHEVEGYRGNRTYNVCPYDFMHDPRVTLGQFQHGEFCCRRVRQGWHQVVMREDAGYYINVDELKKHVTGDRGATLGSSEVERPITDAWIYEDDFDSTQKSEDRNPAMITGWEFYVRLIPKQWGVGDTNYPQIWCFSITEDLDLIFGASPLGYVHGDFPFDVAEIEIEAYGLYNRGVPEIMQPIQETMDWLVNSHFYNVRAAMNNQFILDPSKLVIQDAKNAGPGFIWRLRPEAYGTDLRTMFMQVPVTDVTRQHLTDTQFIQGFGEKTLGVNDAMQGMMQGGRRTATETRITSAFGVNRQKTVAEWLSASAFSPHSQKLVQTSQQMYDVQGKLRIVGDLILDAGKGFVDFDPQKISGFYDFIPVDGTMPVDRMAQANLWKELMANLQRMPPQVQQGYDWGRVFGWVAVLAGMRNIKQFRIQVVPDEQLQMDQQAGNVIPMRPNVPRLSGPNPGIQPGNAASTAAGLPALGGPEY